MFPFLSWIPILGPIIDGFFGWLNKRQDVDLQKYITDGKVDIAAIQSSADMVRAQNDDIGLRLLRDVAVAVPVTWSALLGWDTIWALHDRSMMWHVADYPANVSYIPGLALGFLLGNLGLNLLRRK